MAYIGKSPQNGVRNRFVYAATQGQTAFTGADSDGKTLAISDALYTDVYQNGVKLKLTTDWSATTTTVTLVNAASVDDVIEIVSFDIFAVPDTVPASTGGTFNGAISATSYGAVSGTTGTFSGDVGIGNASPTQALDVTGDIVVSGGVYLGGTVAANLLDDYEEGTWTPSVGGDAGYNSQVGKYTKVGNMVTVWFNQYLATIGTGSTTTISGLPFAVSDIAEFNVNGNQLSYFTGLNGTYTFVAAYVVRNATTMKFVTVGGSGASSSSADTAVLQSNCDIYGNITYRTG